VKSANLNSTLTNLEGDGSGWGFNVSALYTRDAFSAGIAFRSAATAKLDGYYTALNPTMVALGQLAPSQDAKLDLNLPWRLQIGVRYEITPQLAAEIDWTRNGWSEFDKIEIKSDVSNATLIEDTNDWEDSNAYRFGLTYQVLDSTQLRFGYSYDEKAQPDDYFSARVPDNDRQLFAIGVGHKLAGGWEIEGGYMYATAGERNYRGSRPYTGSGGDINGTTAVAGKYESDVHLIALEVSTGFDAF
jgi:long-chain fatty acid transport protein